MITLDPTFFVFVYVSAGLGLMLALWLYYDEHDRRVYERERSHSLYHCLKCGRLYSAPRHLRECACPACDFANAKMKF